MPIVRLEKIGDVIMATVKNFMENFIIETKIKIIELANSELDNKDKKAALDEKMKEWLNTAVDNLPVNFVVKWAIKKYIIANVAVFTQAIYDLLKDKIAGITKEG